VPGVGFFFCLGHGGGVIAEQLLVFTQGNKEFLNDGAHGNAAHDGAEAGDDAAEPYDSDLGNDLVVGTDVAADDEHEQDQRQGRDQVGCFIKALGQTAGAKEQPGPHADKWHQRVKHDFHLRFTILQRLCHRVTP